MTVQGPEPVLDHPKPGATATLRSAARRTAPRRALLISIAAGVLVALFVVLVGGVYLATRDRHYEATASIVVLPDRNLSPADSVSALDSLSRGQTVATFARVLGGLGLTSSALDRLGVKGSARAGVGTDFHAVPDTSIVDVTVSAPSAARAESVAAKVADEAAATR
ncbi:MAG TPA: hypothetical protein VEP49_01720, partial [Acidimicrobiia bacterium]|nr:hypothetical protein [Acidimicrobiia bacterium]